jgi:hypothetical protein
MGSPVPVPLSLVVKNALKIWSACSGGNPTPVSTSPATLRIADRGSFLKAMGVAGKLHRVPQENVTRG